MLDDWDILFTETVVPMVVEWCAEGRALYRDMIERAEDGTAVKIEFRLIQYFAAMASYLVNRRSVRSICEILGQELDRGARSPIDLLIRTKAKEGKLRVRSLFPFITSIRPGKFPSTVREGIKMPKSRLAMELHRYSYFVEADLNAALDLADRRLANPDEGPQERLHARIAGFASTDSFERY
jgi:hypothetical protein